MTTNRRLEWRELECGGEVPVGRVGETLTTADDQSAIYMLGGMIERRGSQATYLDEFVEFQPDASTWARRRLLERHDESPTPPTPEGSAPSSSSSSSGAVARAFHTTVVDRGLLYVFGGCTESGLASSDVLCVRPGTAGAKDAIVEPYRPGTPGSLGTLVTAPSSPPLPRYAHSAVVFDQGMYVFGGKVGDRESQDRLSELHRFDLTTGTWSSVEQHGEVPPPRSSHSAVVCGRRMYVVGGRRGEHNCPGDIFEYSFDSAAWRRIPAGADRTLERARHTAVVHNGVMAVFGGWNGKRRLNDLYLHPLDGSTSDDVETTQATAPCRRDCHAAVMWRNSMVVFSGRYGSNPTGDLHVVRLGPKSLVAQCLDWCASHNLGAEDDLPDRLQRRLKAWEELHSPMVSRQPSSTSASSVAESTADTPIP